MEKNIFLVQGRAPEPYHVAIYTEDNRIVDYRCSCPAGDIGNILCKHVLAVLSGDTTNMVNPDLNSLDKINTLIQIPEFKEIYLKFKELLSYETFYTSIKELNTYIGGKLNNNYQEVKESLEKDILIKVRPEKNFIEETFQYERKEYFDFYDNNLNYLFTTFSDIDEDFFKILKKKKIKLDTKSFKNFSFYTTSDEINDKINTYNKNKKKLSEYRSDLRYMLESYLSERY